MLHQLHNKNFYPCALKLENGMSITIFNYEEISIQYGEIFCPLLFGALPMRWDIQTGKCLVKKGEEGYDVVEISPCEDWLGIKDEKLEQRPSNVISLNTWKKQKYL